MTPSDDFILVDAQSSLFLDDPGGDIAIHALGFLQKEYGDILDGHPLIVPLPRTAPPELPRLTLQSADGLWRANVFLNRIDIHNFSPSGEVGVDIEKMKNISGSLLTGYAMNLKVSIRRMASVYHYFRRDDHAPSSLTRQFCYPQWGTTVFNDLAQFEIHAHKVREMGIYRVNCWTRVIAQQLFFLRGGVTSPSMMGIYVESDINTVADSNTVFDKDSVHRYLSVADTQHRSTLDSYFPREG